MNEDDPTRIAVGHQSGRLVVTNFASSNLTTIKEFVPKHSRPCNTVSWNPYFKNLIGVGFEKLRSDYGTLVWDMERAGKLVEPVLVSRVEKDPGASAENSLFNLANNVGSTIVTQPSFELGHSEATNALAWCPSSPNCLAAGTASQWLRIYDLRGTPFPTFTIKLIPLVSCYVSTCFSVSSS